ncbi:hypothetical protein J6590_034284 [Homalodisca vitripennis]|nr:hypothetical protein J6590_034284 [Homalodisca vitripennis]
MAVYTVAQITVGTHGLECQVSQVFSRVSDFWCLGLREREYPWVINILLIMAVYTVAQITVGTHGLECKVSQLFSRVSDFWCLGITVGTHGLECKVSQLFSRVSGFWCLWLREREYPWVINILLIMAVYTVAQITVGTHGLECKVSQLFSRVSGFWCLWWLRLQSPRPRAQGESVVLSSVGLLVSRGQ